MRLNRPATTYPAPNLSNTARGALTLACMCDDLKRQFYTACPVWYWPVLWWQFVIMERYLARLYAATGKVEMAYGLALGPHGRLRLIHLSDTARHYAMHGHLPTAPWSAAQVWMPASPLPDYPCHDFTEPSDPAPMRAAAHSSGLYLDPG